MTRHYLHLILSHVIWLMCLMSFVKLGTGVPKEALYTGKCVARNDTTRPLLGDITTIKTCIVECSNLRSKEQNTIYAGWRKMVKECVCFYRIFQFKDCAFGISDARKLDIYSTVAVIFKESFLLSSLIQENATVSFVVMYETTMLPSLDTFRRDIIVKVDGIPSNFSVSYLSPQEILTVIQKTFPENLSYRIKVNMNGSLILDKHFRVVNRRQFNARFTGDKSNAVFLGNGSIAVLLSKVISFKVDSVGFDIESVMVNNRRYVPKLCATERILANVLNCSRNKSIVITVKKSLISIKFMVRGLYTITLDMKDNTTKQIYRHTIQQANYIIAQETIIKACISAKNKTDKTGNSYFELIANVKGLSFNYDLKYTWIVRGAQRKSEVVIEKENLYNFYPILKSLSDKEYTVELEVSNYVSKYTTTLIDQNIPQSINNTMIKVSKENPIILGDHVILKTSDFFGINKVEWKINNKDAKPIYRGRFGIFYQPLAPGHIRFIAELKNNKGEKADPHEDIYVLDKIASFRVNHEFNTIYEVSFGGDFNADWYNASFYNDSYNPVFVWDFGDNSTKTTNSLFITHKFAQKKRYLVTMFVSNILSNYTRKFPVYINKKICKVNLDIVWPPRTILYLKHSEMLEIHPSVVVNCTSELHKNASFEWTEIGMNDGLVKRNISKLQNLRYSVSDCLRVGEIKFRIKVQFNDMEVSEYITVNITYSGLKPVITYNDIPLTNTEFQISSNNVGQIELSGSSSKDLDNKQSMPSDFRYEWECKNVDRNSKGCFKNTSNIILRGERLKFNVQDFLEGNNKKETFNFRLFVIDNKNLKESENPDVAVIHVVNDAVSSFLLKCDTCSGNKQSPQKVTRVRLVCPKNKCLEEGIEITWRLDKENTKRNIEECTPNIAPIIPMVIGNQRGTASSNVINKKGTNRHVKNSIAPSLCVDWNDCSNEVVYSSCKYNISSKYLVAIEEEGNKLTFPVNNISSKYLAAKEEGNNLKEKKVKTTRKPIGVMELTNRTRLPGNGTIKNVWDNQNVRIKTWTADPHKELDDIEAPFQYSKVMFMINSGVLLDKINYRLIVTIKEYGREIGTTQLDFAGGKKSQGDCVLFTKEGNELHTGFKIRCNNWSERDSLVYQVQFRNKITSTWETVLISQTFKLFFFLPLLATDDRNTTQETIRLTIENENGDLNTLCPMTNVILRRTSNPTMDGIEDHLKQLLKPNLLSTVEPQTLGSRFIAYLLKANSLQANTTSDVNTRTRIKDLICDVTLRMLDKRLLLAMKFSIMKHLLNKPSEVSNASFHKITAAITDIRKTTQTPSCKNEFGPLHYDINKAKSPEYTNDVIKVLSKTLHKGLVIYPTNTKLKQSILKKLVQFLRTRDSIYGVYANYSSEHLEVRKETQVGSKKYSTKYKMFGNITLLAEFNEDKSHPSTTAQWCETSYVAFKIQHNSYLIYIDIKKYIYDGTYQRKGDRPIDVSYQLQLTPTRNRNNRGAGEGTYRLKWQEKISHRIVIPKNAKVFYVLLNILEKGGEHYNFFLDAQISNSRNYNLAPKRMQFSKNGYIQVETTSSDSPYYFLTVDLFMKEKLSKKVRSIPFFDYSLDIVLPVCNTSFANDDQASTTTSAQPRCQSYMTADRKFVCRCKGTGFIEHSTKYLPHPDFKQSIKKREVGSLVPITLLCSLVIFYLVTVLVKFCQQQFYNDVDEIVEVPENHPCDVYNYHFIIETGHCIGAGTSARVCIVLHGTLGHSQKIELTRADKTLFQRSSNSMVIASCPKHLGELTHLQLWHDNKNKSPDWYIKQIAVQDKYFGKIFYFPVQNWLSLTKGLRKTSYCLVATMENCQSKFQVVLEKMLDYHVAVSLFVGPRTSSFSYFERVFCLLASFLYYFTVTIVFFRDYIKTNAFSLELLHIENNDVFWVASMTVFSFLPISIILSIIFRVSDQEFSGLSVKSLFTKRKNKIADSSRISSTIATNSSQGVLLYNQMLEEQMSSKQSNTTSLVTWSLNLSYYTRLLAMVIVLSVTLLSGVVVWIESFSVGTEEVNAWIQLTLAAMLLDVILFSPIVAFVNSLAYLVLFWGCSVEFLFQKMITYKRSDQDKKTEQTSFPQLKAMMVRDRSRFIRYSEPMSAEDAKKKRKKRSKKILVKKIYNRIFYLLILAILSITFLYTEYKCEYKTYDQHRSFIRSSSNIESVKWLPDFKVWVNSSIGNLSKSNLWLDRIETKKIKLLGSPIFDIESTDFQNITVFDNATDTILSVRFLSHPDVYISKVKSFSITLLVSEHLNGIPMYSLIKFKFVNHIENFTVESSMDIDFIVYQPYSLGLNKKTLSMVCQFLVGLVALVKFIHGYSKTLQKPMSYISKIVFKISFILLSFVISTFWVYQKVAGCRFELALDEIRYNNQQNEAVMIELTQIMVLEKIWKGCLGVFIFMICLKMLWFMRLFNQTSNFTTILKTGIARVLPYMVFPAVIVLACAHSITILATTESMLFSEAIKNLIFNFKSVIHTVYSSNQEEHLSSFYITIVCVFSLWIIVRVSFIFYLGMFRKKKKLKRLINFQWLFRKGFEYVSSYMYNVRNGVSMPHLPSRLPKKYVYKEIDYQLEELLYRLNEFAISEKFDDDFDRMICKSIAGSNTAIPSDGNLDNDFDYPSEFSYTRNSMDKTLEFCDSSSCCFYGSSSMMSYDENRCCSDDNLPRYNKITYVATMPDNSKLMDEKQPKKILPSAPPLEGSYGERQLDFALKEIYNAKEAHAKTNVVRKLPEINDVDLTGWKWSNVRPDVKSHTAIVNSVVIDSTPRKLRNHITSPGDFARPVLKNIMEKEKELEKSMQKTIQKLETMSRRLTEMEVQERIQETEIRQSLRKKQVTFSNDYIEPSTEPQPSKKDLAIPMKESPTPIMFPFQNTRLLRLKISPKSVESESQNAPTNQIKPFDLSMVNTIFDKCATRSSSSPSESTEAIHQKLEKLSSNKRRRKPPNHNYVDSEDECTV